MRMYLAERAVACLTISHRIIAEIVARGRAFRAMLAKIAMNKNRLDSGLVHSGSISIMGAEITHHHPWLVFVVTRRFPLDDIERQCTPIISCHVSLLCNAPETRNKDV